MADFHRTFVNDDSFIRGAGRLLIAPIGETFPTKIGDIVQLATTTANEVQSLSVTGTPSGGTYRLGFRGDTTAAIAHNANAAAIVAALEGLDTVGPGDVGVSGTDPGPFTITFQGGLAGGNVPQLTLDANNLTGGTTPSVTLGTTTPGQGQYDALGGWQDLGATKTGIQITINNSEETFDIDQVLGDIESAPNAWECSVGTQLAEMTLERLQVAWEGSAISLDATPSTGPEKEIGFGQPTSYTRRRLAVLYQRSNGLIRAYIFRKVQRMPQESSVTHQKTGEQISIPVRWKSLADTSVSDVKKRFFIIRDQQSTG